MLIIFSCLVLLVASQNCATGIVNQNGVTTVGDNQATTFTLAAGGSICLHSSVISPSLSTPSASKYAWSIQPSSPIASTPYDNFPTERFLEAKDWLPYARKAMLDTWNRSAFSTQDMTPVILSDPYILIENGNTHLRNKPKLEERGLAMRAAILDQIRPCEFNKQLKTRATRFHKKSR